MMNEKLGELLSFRQEWEKELKKNRHFDDRNGKLSEVVKGEESGLKVKSGKHVSLKNTAEVTNFEDIGHGSVTFKLQQDTNAAINSQCTDNKEQEIILLSLPDPETKIITSKAYALNSLNIKNKKQKTSNESKSTVWTSDQTLLDQLISDIDEITTIPFFDLQLPREVGVKILGYLSMKDLCQCAVVSKSWRSLADDELLWFNLGCNKGFVSNKCTIVEKSNWKGFVLDCVIKDRCLKGRWKERVCKISPMEYERGGSLSAMSVLDDLLCAGYSSGNILLWDLDGCGVPTYKIMEPILDGQQKPCSTCTAVTKTLCIAGFDNGAVNIWHTSLSSSPLYHCRTEGPVKMVAIATDKEPTAVSVSDHELRVDVADANGQWKCHEQRTFENKIEHMKMLPSTNKSTCHQIAIATRDTIQLHKTSRGSNVTVIDHVIGGKMTCLDCTADLLAVGVGPYGYGVLRNKVRLYCSSTARLISLLSGHYQEITCLNLKHSPPNYLITGSYDKRVRIFDLRTGIPALTLRGHEDYITTVQMDDWKVVSGAHNGMVSVWDQRMGSTLWSTNARHPVRLCHFNGVKLVTGNIPDEKNPHESLWYADDLILHRKNRGTLRVFDFETENGALGVPEICLSSYDDTAGYNYNIALATPYDMIGD